VTLASSYPATFAFITFCHLSLCHTLAPFLQVLDSIGVDIAASMQAAPGRRVAAAQANKAGTSAEEELDDDLVNRLAQLKS
jgi:hypothetical protein